MKQLLPILAVVALAGCGAAHADTPAAPVASQIGADGHFAGTEITPPFAPPAGSFASTTGSGSYDLASTVTGHVTLLFFGYTECPDVCPTTMADLGQALRSLPTKSADDVRVVFVTSDPHHDTTAVMAKWLSNFDEGLPTFVGLRTDFPAVQAYAKQVGVELDTPQTDAEGVDTDTHSAQVLAFSADGKAHLVWTPGITVAQYSSDISKLVAGVT